MFEYKISPELEAIIALIEETQYQELMEEFEYIDDEEPSND